jgi:hypothetical protein
MFRKDNLYNFGCWLAILIVIRIDYLQLMAKYPPPTRNHLTIRKIVREEQRWKTMER